MNTQGIGKIIGGKVKENVFTTMETYMWGSGQPEGDMAWATTFSGKEITTLVSGKMTSSRVEGLS